MSSWKASVAFAGACVGVLGCGGSPAVRDAGATTPIAGCPDLSGYAACAATEVTGPFVPRRASVLLVTERSGRLLRVPDGASTDLWSAMTTGLAAALDRPWTNVEFTMLGYPSSMSTGCGEGCCYMLPASSAVRGPFGPESAARIVEVLLSDQPEGEAPMAAALATARQYLTEVDVPAQGDVYVVLVAGGGPDCSDGGACGADRCVPNLEARCAAGGNCCAGAPAGCLDAQNVRDQIRALAAAGIATLVVALPGAGDFTALFDDLALAGGRPDPVTGGAYPSGVTTAQIQATMTAIFARLDARCEAALPGALSAADVAQVAVGCALRPDATAAGARVVLESDACAALGATAPPAVHVLHGCSPSP